MSSVAIASFRWLDTLEKEFDKAFIEFDFLLNNLIYDSDNGDLVDDVIIEFADNCRDKIKIMNSCWSQIVHKSQTIFQVNCKLEAQIVNLKSDLIEANAFKQTSEKEIEKIMIELHQAQLEIQRLKSNIPANTINAVDNEVDAIHKKLEHEWKKRFGPENEAMNLALIQAELNEYKRENESLKEQHVNLNSEIFGSRLTAKYLEKELAGRIQQIQLFGKNLKPEEHERLWNQLESEINLHRHKTVMKACINKRINKINSKNVNDQPMTSKSVKINRASKDLEYLKINKLIGVVRTVHLKRNSKEGLGISITGGQEHGVPVLISDVHENGPAARCELFVGDTILSVNDIDLKDQTHGDAVRILSNLIGDVTLKVIFLEIDDQNDDIETSSVLDLAYPFLNEQLDANNNNKNCNNNSTVKSDFKVEKSDSVSGKSTTQT